MIEHAIETKIAIAGRSGVAAGSGSERRCLRNLSLSLMAGVVLSFASGFASPTPASAQQASWEIGCAYRSLPTGNGEAQRTYNCERQKMCQQMANDKGAMMMEMGCFGVTPAAAPTPQAGRLRPTQQQ